MHERDDSASDECGFATLIKTDQNGAPTELLGYALYKSADGLAELFGVKTLADIQDEDIPELGVNFAEFEDASAGRPRFSIRSLIRLLQSGDLPEPNIRVDLVGRRTTFSSLYDESGFTENLECIVAYDRDLSHMLVNNKNVVYGRLADFPRSPEQDSVVTP